MIASTTPGVAKPARFLVPALAVSRFGDELYYLAMPLLVYDIAQSTTAMGIQYATEYLPLLSLPLIGIAVDRINRAKLLVVSDLIRIGLLLMVPLLLRIMGLGPNAVLTLYTVGFLLTAWSQVFEVGLEASLPGVVGRENLGKVYAQLSTWGSAARLVGPAVTGWLVGQMGAQNVLLIDAVTFLATLMAVLHMWRAGLLQTAATGQETSGEQAGFKAIIADVKSGFAYIFGHPLLRSISIVYFVLMIGVQFGMTLLVFYYRDQVGLSAAQVGLLMTASGGAQFLAASAGAWLQKRLGKGRLVVAGVTCAGVGWLVTSLSHQWWGLLLGGMLLACPQAPVAATVAALQQQVTPGEMLGRVGATSRWLAWVSLPFSALFAGAIAEAFGAQNMLAFSGSVILIAALIGRSSALRNA